MTTTARRPHHLFVVRMWQEADAVTATVQWRGSVKHPLSNECHYFIHLPGLLAFIAATTNRADGITPVQTAVALEQP